MMNDYNSYSNGWDPITGWPRPIERKYSSPFKPIKGDFGIPKASDILKELMEKGLDGAGPGSTQNTGAPADQGVSSMNDMMSMNVEDQMTAVNQMDEMGPALGLGLPGGLGSMASLSNKSNSASLSKNIAADLTAATGGHGGHEAPTGQEFSFDPQMSQQSINATMNEQNVNGGDTGSGTKVICTELHRQGLLPQEIYEADLKYVNKVDPEVRAGYLAWGIPLVSCMRGSALITRFVHFFAKHWANHMAYEMGVLDRDDLFGKILNGVGQPVCKLIGKFKYLHSPIFG